MKIVTVIGARPQFIKAATISRVVESMDNIEEVVIHTGQHFDDNMSDIFFEQMAIPKPHYHLHVDSLSHGAMTGRMLEKIEQILIQEKPDWVLVYGDTNSTLAGALAASKLHIKIAHVEAGLRSFNMKMPEEQNRILTDRLSSILFCPTKAAKNNLLKEGYQDLPSQVSVVGDVMYDAALFYIERAQKPLSLNFIDVDSSFALATVHRAENTDDKNRLTEIVGALNEISKFKKVVLPIHPRTKNKFAEFGLSLDVEVEVIEPVGYLEMVYLLKNCDFVLSDSGGVQKEANFFNKQCLILRDETEWVELVECGANQIVGASKLKILEAFNLLTFDIDVKQQFYGTGNAAEIIVTVLEQYPQ